MRYLPLLFAMLSTMSSAQAQNASNHIVSFFGEILNQTCEVSTESRQQTVRLPSVPKHQLRMSGQTSEATTFQIKLTGCTENADLPYLQFLSGDEVDSTTGTLKNMASEAKAQNVQIQLLFGHDGQMPIMLGQPNAGRPTSRVGIVQQGDSVTLTYQARYYATGMVMAGKVESMIRYMIAYQ